MSRQKSPWLWVPTLYFAEGIPYFIVNVVSVTMFKRLGMGNADLAMYTSLLYLPWVIKPLWSPLVDIVRTKRWWIVVMQALMTVCFAAIALGLPSRTGAPVSAFTICLIFFYITAMLSATHDIAADGYYMLALDEHQQSLFVGIRSTFYRIASVFGQGVIVVVAGLLETHYEDIPRAWTMTLLMSAAIFLAVTIWHQFILPAERPSATGKEPGPGIARSQSPRSFLSAFATFFRKPGVGLAIVFMLLYRLPEALSVKMLTPFLLDPMDAGGLGLSTAQSGLVYGTVGVIALTVGGILGGVWSAKVGLRKALWPMALALALPCSVYLYMAMAQPSNLFTIYFCVALDQFGYGFGFTAYMLYMMFFSQGEYSTSHYAVCTAFMALSMMIPGFFAGMLQETLGYSGFFVLVMVCCLATVAVTAFLPSRIDPGYGRK
ncbi:MAG: MFS transporter [Bacteroidales bacterium]|nr:MFS transporter [Bacteroidales bacterium]